MAGPDNQDDGKVPGKHGADGDSGREIDDVLSEAIEFLISSGHSFSDIRDYSLPQVILFQHLIVTRWNKQAEAQKKGEKSQNKKGDDPDKLVVSSYRDLHGRGKKQRR